jgi:peptidoglycan hydrolase-like protein with peptidoglycan-binding domain
MAGIMTSVGQGGINRDSDVRSVQTALNTFAAKLGILPLRVDGKSGPKTIDAIKKFQRVIVRAPVAGGKIDPNDQTARALFGSGAAAPAPAAAGAAGPLSGAAWWHANQAKWPNEHRLEVLTEPFKSNITKFIAALKAAGASVILSDTLRSKTRGTLMRYSWDVAHGLLTPNKVPAIPGVSINWNHGDVAKSKKAASDMVKLFGIVKQPSLGSNHYKGLAVDMTIGWTGTLKIKSANGKTITSIDGPRNGQNAKLYSVGATYNVFHKLPTDPPHWSSTGN